MNQRTGGGLKPFAAALLLLCASTPPAWFPSAEWLVLPGLMAWYSLCTAARRPRRWSYLLGLCHMLVFTWSVRHFAPTEVLGFVLVLAIAAVGGLYYLLAAELMVRLRRWWGPLTFGLAVALANWLRANMVEVPYPHGQPCHALWQHPWTLGTVRWGGEVLANGLLAALAAALWDLARSWQVAVPSWRAAWLRLAAAVLLMAACCALRPPQAAIDGNAAEATVAVAAIEPELEPNFQANRAEYPRLFRERFEQPTLKVAGTDATGAVPDLVLWPEGTFDGAVWLEGTRMRLTRAMSDPLRLHPGTRLVVGGDRLQQVDGQDTPAAILLDDRGRYLAHQEKRVLVPVGEYQPFLHWLPDAWRQSIEERIKAASGGILPASVPGEAMAPLTTAAGVPFGALHCFDNAFPGPAREQVARGARFLCVLSNEAWYHGGAELDQLVAQTVIRTLETSTPFVRCTVDGWSLAVDGEGRVIAELPRLREPRAEARVLRVFMPLGPGRLGPMAWLPSAVVWTMLGLIATGLLHGAAAWARLPSVRPSRHRGPGAVPGPVADSGGS